MSVGSAAVTSFGSARQPRLSPLAVAELGDHRLGVEAAAAGVSAAVSDVTRDACRAIQTTVGRRRMIKRSSPPDGRKRSGTPQRGRLMDYLLMRLRNDEELL